MKKFTEEEVMDIIDKISELIKERQTVSYLQHRCLYNKQKMQEDYKLSTIGDNELSENLKELEYESFDEETFKNLFQYYYGDDIEDYIQEKDSDELISLDNLVGAVEEFLYRIYE